MFILVKKYCILGILSALSSLGLIDKDQYCLNKVQEAIAQRSEKQFNIYFYPKLACLNSQGYVECTLLYQAAEKKNVPPPIFESLVQHTPLTVQSQKSNSPFLLYQPLFKRAVESGNYPLVKELFSKMKQYSLSLNYFYENLTPLACAYNQLEMVLNMPEKEQERFFLKRTDLKKIISFLQKAEAQDITQVDGKPQEKNRKYLLRHKVGPKLKTQLDVLKQKYQIALESPNKTYPGIVGIYNNQFINGQFRLAPNRGIVYHDDFLHLDDFFVQDAKGNIFDWKTLQTEFTPEEVNILSGICPQTIEQTENISDHVLKICGYKRAYSSTKGQQIHEPISKV